MLAATGLVKRYGPRTVVNGVAVQVERGETVGLLGPNGAGKTTTFYMMVGLVRPDAGEVLLDGASLTAMPVHERARHRRQGRPTQQHLPRNTPHHAPHHLD